MHESIDRQMNSKATDRQVSRVPFSMWRVAKFGVLVTVLTAACCVNRLVARADSFVERSRQTARGVNASLEYSRKDVVRKASRLHRDSSYFWHDAEYQASIQKDGSWLVTCRNPNEYTIGSWQFDSRGRYISGGCFTYCRNTGK